MASPMTPAERAHFAALSEAEREMARVMVRLCHRVSTVPPKGAYDTFDRLAGVDKIATSLRGSARQRAQKAAAPLVESFFASPAGAACAPAASASDWLRHFAGGAVAPAAAPAAASSARARVIVARPLASAPTATTGFARAVDVALEQLDALIAAKHGAAPPAKRTKRLFGDATNVVLGF